MIHRMKNYLLYKDATCLCSLSAAFSELLARSSSIELFFLVVLFGVFLAFCRALFLSEWFT